MSYDDEVRHELIEQAWANPSGVPEVLRPLTLVTEDGRFVRVRPLSRAGAGWYRIVEDQP